MKVLREEQLDPHHIFNGNAVTAAMADELLSPLVLIRQLGLTLTDELISDEDRRLLGRRLTLTSERAMRLINNLTLSSIDQSSLQLEPINPTIVCREVMHELRPLFKEYDTSIELQARSRTPLLVGDRRLLQDILLGLGDNAIHFGTHNQPVRMMVKAEKNFVRIGVRDFGPAVPVRLWDMLEKGVIKQAAAPFAGRTSASGITLLVARQLAEMMGGKIGLIRHHDGATFYIDLLVSRQMNLI